MSKRQKLNDLKLKHKARKEYKRPQSIVSVNPVNSVKPEQNDKSLDDIANLVKNEPVISTIINKVNVGSKRAKLDQLKQKQRNRKITHIQNPPVQQPSKCTSGQLVPIHEPTYSIPEPSERTHATKKERNTNNAKSKREQIRKNKECREKIRREHAEQIHNDMLSKYGIKIDDIEIDKALFERICIAILNEFDQNKSYKKAELMSQLQYKCDIINLKGVTNADITTTNAKGLYLFVLQKIMKDIDSSLLEEDTFVLKDTRILQDENFVKDNKKYDNKEFLMSVRLDLGYNSKEHPDEMTTLLFSGREIYKNMKLPNEKDMKNGYVPDTVKASLVKTDFENELDNMFKESLTTQSSTTKKVQLFSL